MAAHRDRAPAPVSGRLARSGIRTRGGRYRKFDSQKVVRDASVNQEQNVSSEKEESLDLNTDSGDESDGQSKTTAYSALLGMINTGRPSKRRKVSRADESAIKQSSEEEPLHEFADELDASQSEDEAEPADIPAEEQLFDSDNEAEGTNDDPYSAHFELSDQRTLSTLIEEVRTSRFSCSRSNSDKVAVTRHMPASIEDLPARRVARTTSNLHLKQRLKQKSHKALEGMQPVHEAMLPLIFSYTDVLCCARTPSNAKGLRQLLAVHATNHVLKSRDKLLKNNSRLAQADDNDMLDLRDQGFARPKVLILTETRQMASNYAEAIVELLEPEVQMHKQRFIDSFTGSITERDMPTDYRDLFDGNNDNNFITTIRVTRKSIKFFSAFYESDIILASPLGLRRIIEHEDKKKRDHDFLSSVEMLILDQGDAMQMQNWENVELVLKHLNLQPSKLRDCDVNRVRHWNLDGNAQYLRQSIVLSAYLTPEINRVYNTSMKNIYGKAKLIAEYQGNIQHITGFGFKQIFSRFLVDSPTEEPDARFKFFTSAVLPQLVKGANDGVLIYIPSYFDFLRVRNFFASSTATENISFGAIHDYAEVSEQRRARAHLLSGKYTFLLYTQRAHHFFRLRIRGVKKVIMYGLPDNDIFYTELVSGYLASSLADGRVNPGEASVRSLFSKFDALKLERIVGSSRVKNMLRSTGDVFEFV